MRIVSDPQEIQSWGIGERCAGTCLALVPTMGCFHEGHLSLMRWARQRCDKLMVSLFVNPTQFAPQEDLQSYPRNMQRDCDLARQEGVDVLFAPAPEAMYAEDHGTWVDIPSLCHGLCAVQRPTHFRGVATVVTKLLLLTNPALAVFGEKDWQQLAVIRALARDLNIPVQIVGRPTVREEDGLAMSSRNVYLSREERKQAPAIHQGLRAVRRQVRQGETDPGILLTKLLEMYTRDMPSAVVEYTALVDPDRLLPVREVLGPTLLAVAVGFSKARLIDNILVPAPGMTRGDSLFPSGNSFVSGC